MKAKFLTIVSLTVTLALLLAPFSASVSAVPAPIPLDEPELFWTDGYVPDALPGWAQQPPPPDQTDIAALGAAEISLRAAPAVPAAVRISVINRPSSAASGDPLAVSNIRITA